MRANPGGTISPENVVGRDRLVERLWRTLDRLGVVLVAERRMGKTCVIKKMQAEAAAQKLVVLSNVEGVSRPLEFAERLLRDIEDQLSADRKTVGWLKRLWAALGGIEIGGVVKLPKAAIPNWKTLLERILRELAQRQKHKVVLIWDELPWMLQKIARTEDQGTVVDLLDVLRHQRQAHANLRMVYTGSIGLHHVVDGLHEEGYANSPINDMRTVEVPPLDYDFAKSLAGDLLRGEGLAADQPEETAEEIARLVDGVPYYIHHVLAELADWGAPVTPNSAAKAVESALCDVLDPWDLSHYRSRLAQYYGDRAGLVREILNLLAKNNPLKLDELSDLLSVGFRPGDKLSREIVEGDPDRLRVLVRLMQRDHYLRREESGAYSFRFDLIRRWWRLDME